MEKFVPEFVSQYGGVLGGGEVRWQGDLPTLGNAAGGCDCCRVFEPDAERKRERGYPLCVVSSIALDFRDGR
jgi:hypothetical protein